MPIYKRGSIWYVRMWNGPKKFERAIGPDRHTAEIVMKNLERERAMAKAANKPWTGLEQIKKEEEQPTIAEAFDGLLADNPENVKASTIENYKLDFGTYIGPKLGDLTVGQVTKERVQQFQKFLREHRIKDDKPLAHSTINKITFHLHSILNYCVGKGWIESNPVLKVKKLRCEPRFVDPFTAQELETVLGLFQGHHKAFFTIMAWSGMRPGEVAALHWNDIDFDRNEIKISKGIYRTIESTPKTTSSNRVIPMHSEIRKILEGLKTSPVKSCKGYILFTRQGRAFGEPAGRIWRQTLKKTEIRYRPHGQLRHTWASLAIQSGEAPAWVSKMLGHSSLATTYKYYARFIPSGNDGLKIANFRPTNGFPTTTETPKLGNLG